MKVLLVANHEEYHGLIQGIMDVRGLGFELCIASSDAQARALFAELGQCSLIIVDEYLHDEDNFTAKGLELIKDIRANGFSGKILTLPLESRQKTLLRNAGADGSWNVHEFLEIVSLQPVA